MIYQNARFSPQDKAFGYGEELNEGTVSRGEPVIPVKTQPVRLEHSQFQAPCLNSPAYGF